MDVQVAHIRDRMDFVKMEQKNMEGEIFQHRKTIAKLTEKLHEQELEFRK